MKARLLPLYFAAANERERGEFNDQLVRLKDFYGDVAEFLEPVCVGEKIPAADAIVFPQLIGAAFKEVNHLKKINLPMVVLTSKFGTVEMWDWEIVTYLRGAGLNVFSPYNIELAKVIIRAIAAKQKLKSGAKFLTFQDSPGEGMQAYIFKRFYWWEKECTDTMEKTFGVKMIYRSWKELNERARKIPDDAARAACADWDIKQEGLSEENYLKAVKIYVAVKEVIQEIGGVDGVGANCLNEPVYDPVTGGCFDGLSPKGPNLNQGSESTICCLLAQLAIAPYIPLLSESPIRNVEAPIRDADFGLRNGERSG
jgi:hypothetical protein